MSNKAKLKDYRISRIDMDLDNLTNGENQIQLSTSINIMIPKDENDSECITEITAAFRSERSKNILLVSIQGFSNIVSEKSGSVISDKEKQSLLKKYVVPELYKELRDFIGTLLENSHIDFMNIPPFDKITE